MKIAISNIYYFTFFIKGVKGISGIREGLPTRQASEVHTRSISLLYMLITIIYIFFIAHKIQYVKSILKIKYIRRNRVQRWIYL